MATLDRRTRAPSARRGELPDFEKRDRTLKRQRLRQKLKRLQARRDRMLRLIRELDARIEMYGDVPRPGRASRPKAPTGTHLADVLVRSLKGRRMTVKDAARAALKSGYRTRAKDFENLVAQQLSRDPRFRRITRGVYTAV